jgi:hypothetical protein
VIQLAAVIVAHAADSTRTRSQSQLTCERLSMNNTGAVILASVFYLWSSGMDMGA